MKHLKLLTVAFFSLLLGTIPLMAEEDGTKCVMIETSQGETLEYYISSHPRLTQNNDKVTLTSDEGALEFSTVGIKKVYTSIATIKVVYTVDGEVYKTETVEYGSTITPPTVEDKIGFDFAWEEYPTTMPANDITISGAYTTGISTIGAGKCITTKNGDFYLSGLQPNEAVKVYSVAGTLLLSAQATVQGELTISRSSLAVGVNIIKTNSQTYKIIKQ
jgi:hypothetical protein